MKSLIPEWAEKQPAKAQLFTPEQIAEVRAITSPPTIKEQRPIITLPDKKHGRRRK